MHENLGEAEKCKLRQRDLILVPPGAEPVITHGGSENLPGRRMWGEGGKSLQKEGALVALSEAGQEGGQGGLG